MLSPRSVLITGASSGSIGSALGVEFAARGFVVFATLRTISKVDASLAALPNVHVLELDVTSDESITAAFHQVNAKTSGSLDYLINNAGAIYTAPLVDVDFTTARKLFDVNFWGVLSMTKGFTPFLIKAKGTVVNFSSVGAVVNTPWIGIYSASKAALTSASETLRLELAPFKVKVVTLMLGVVKSNLHVNTLEYRLPEGSIYSPIDEQIRVTDSGKLDPKAMDVKPFVKLLIKDLLDGKQGRLWKGNVASTVKWASNLLPTPVFDNLVSRGKGLDEISKMQRNGPS